MNQQQRRDQIQAALDKVESMILADELDLALNEAGPDVHRGAIYEHLKVLKRGQAKMLAEFGDELEQEEEPDEPRPLHQGKARGAHPQGRAT